MINEGIVGTEVVAVGQNKEQRYTLYSEEGVLL
jgi:hypothetical protein